LEKIDKVLDDFDKDVREEIKHSTVTFSDYLQLLSEEPELLLRDIFQVFHDMVHYYVPGGVNEYPDDPESINYVQYDFTRLFVKGSDNPFFADRLFGNRFMNLVNSFRQGSQHNKLYFFEGPPGSGKSTFLKNLLYRFERYMKTDDGTMFETVWKIERSRFMFNSDYLLQLRSPGDDTGGNKLLNTLQQAIGSQGDKALSNYSISDLLSSNTTLVVPCPSHDHPILQIPKKNRKKVLDSIIQDGEFKKRLFTDKKYKWVFKDEPCTICSSIYEALMEKFDSPLDVLQVIFPRRVRFNRRLGEGISVYNPGDTVQKSPIKNKLLQDELDKLFAESNRVKYVHSRLAKTNNGIFVAMDIKQHNKDRVLNLHGIISDGIHKVEDIEENINSIFIGLINPQDKDFIEETESLKDRIQYTKIPYILDYTTEVEIYKNNFGQELEHYFLPLALENFARIIISSRLNQESAGLSEWISTPSEYTKQCDEKLLLLKMEIYTGHIPGWISESDQRAFNSRLRKAIIDEGANEGFTGFSGRESINVFHDFLSKYRKSDKMINMEMVYDFFTRDEKRFGDKVTKEFLDSLMRSYDYRVLQQVKESLYSYNKSQISRNIQNYIFAVNFELDTTEKNHFTGQVVDINEDFFRSIEDFFIGPHCTVSDRQEFRKDVLHKYITKTATRELQIEKKKLTQTDLYKELHEKYMRNLKENSLDPLIENENFRNAVKEYKRKEFESHDKKIKKDVTSLISNLIKKYGYTEAGAKDICIYVIDKQI
jgi:predicted Ser/Thr protein kinase